MESPIFGISRIIEERVKQIQRAHSAPGRDDDASSGELAMAAIAYASPIAIEDNDDEYADAVLRVVSKEELLIDSETEPVYPFAVRPHNLFNGKRHLLPVDVRIEQLAIAGALIAAEIDRLERTKSRAAKMETTQP